MDQVIRILKAHKGQIIRYGKKAFKWFQNRQKQQQQQQGGGAGGGGGGYAGAAGGGYPQQNQQQQQYYGGPGGGGGYQQQQQQQQQQYYGGAGGYDHPPPQGQYGHSPGAFNPPSTGVKPNHGRYNDNEVNQKNEHYRQLRAQAHSEGDKMAKCFDDSHKAYASGDGSRAKQLSNEGHEHKRRMEQANGEAADWIFKANNEDSGPDEIDLHGLYTQEAIDRTEQAVRQFQSQGRPTMRVIVGKGIHSKDHVAHIKPAIEKLMRDNNISAALDPHNAGVLVVHLQGGSNVGDAGFTRDLAKGATGKDDECTIM